MGKLWEIVQQHIDAQPYGASQRSVAAKLGVSPTALGNWRDPKALPAPANLHALANLTGTPYLRVLDAALEDAGYIPRAGEHGGNTAATNPAGGSPATDIREAPPARPGVQVGQDDVELAARAAPAGGSAYERAVAEQDAHGEHGA